MLPAVETRVRIRQLCLAGVLAVAMATAFNALFVERVNASGGCCCDDDEVWSTNCPSVDDCENDFPGTTCCYTGACFLD